MIQSNGDIKVVVVEDDDAFREHLEALIGGASGYQCLGAHRTAETALKHLPLAVPDVLLMDLELPHTSGLEMIAKVVAHWPKLAVVVLTIHDDSVKIAEALEAGAIGYLVKPVSPVRLLEALAEAHAGGSPMSSQIARLVVRRFQNQSRSRHTLDSLTVRELEILDHISRGLTTDEVAQQLAISGRTVGSHLRKIYDKLHVHSRTAAIARLLGR